MKYGWLEGQRNEHIYDWVEQMDGWMMDGLKVKKMDGQMDRQTVEQISRWRGK